MKNRLCISEETLGEYLSGYLDGKKRSDVEDHIADCEQCRRLLVDAYMITGALNRRKKLRRFPRVFVKNIWGVTAFCMFVMSFILRGHFMQFLAASVISGIKWISDSKATKTLIAVYSQFKRDKKIDRTGKTRSKY